MTRTRIQPQDIEDRGVHPAKLGLATDGQGNFALLGIFSGTVIIYDEQTLEGSADRLRFYGGGVTVNLSGSMAHISIPGGGGDGGGTVGIFGLDNGVPLGTGTWLEFGDGLNGSISGTTLRVDAVPPVFPQEVIGVYALQDGVPLGTGSWLEAGDNLNASLSGTVVRLDSVQRPPFAGVDQIGFYLRDEGANVGTGTIINFVGDQVFTSLSGTVATIFVGDPSGGTGTTVVYDEESLVGSFSEMRYIGGGVDVSNSGTYAAIGIPGGPAIYSCKVVRTSTNNFVNGYTIVWTAAPDDDLGMWTSGTAIYVPYDGFVSVHANVGFVAAGGSGRWYCQILKDGGQVAYFSDHISDFNSSPHASIGTSIPVTSGSYFQVVLFNGSGSGKNSATDCQMTLLLFVP